jgi:hypothetical protein
VISLLSDYYRVPDSLNASFSVPKLSGSAGFFCLGPETVCYGQCESGVVSGVKNSALRDASAGVSFTDAGVALPFDPAEVIENLRSERYERHLVPQRERFVTQEWIRKSYYFVREILPVSVRRHIQRAYFSDWASRTFPAWPVDFTVDTLHEKFLKFSMEASGTKRMPFIWFWPDGAPSCLIMTHDVETSVGRDFTSKLMDVDDSYGIKASFQVIPEKRYTISDEYIREIRNRGFEFNVHDLNHDGNLYREREEFLRRAARINDYVHRYDSRGFRAGAMYRIQDWYGAFDFSYDMSVPNVAHLEPMRGGCCTVMPYFVGKILELPLTTAQDYSLFHILNDYSIDLWKRQTELIKARNGLMSFIAHPDYVNERRALRVYELLLGYLREMVDREGVWATLPGEVDRWWRARSQMKLVRRGQDWEIVGEQKERARLAYAVLDGDRLVYKLAGNVPAAKRAR